MGPVDPFASLTFVEQHDAPQPQAQAQTGAVPTGGDIFGSGSSAIGSVEGAVASGDRFCRWKQPEHSGHRVVRARSVFGGARREPRAVEVASHINMLVRKAAAVARAMAADAMAIGDCYEGHVDAERPDVPSTGGTEYDTALYIAGVWKDTAISMSLGARTQLTEAGVATDHPVFEMLVDDWPELVHRAADLLVAVRAGQRLVCGEVEGVVFSAVAAPSLTSGSGVVCRNGHGDGSGDGIGDGSGDGNATTIADSAHYSPGMFHALRTMALSVISRLFAGSVTPADAESGYRQQPGPGEGDATSGSFGGGSCLRRGGAIRTRRGQKGRRWRVLRRAAIELSARGANQCLVKWEADVPQLGHPATATPSPVWAPLCDDRSAANCSHDFWGAPVPQRAGQLAMSWASLIREGVTAYYWSLDECFASLCGLE